LVRCNGTQARPGTPQIPEVQLVEVALNSNFHYRYSQPMKLGILNAIHPDKSQVNWDGSPIDAYIRFFESANAGFEYMGFEVAQGQLPVSPEVCDAYVITGSPTGVYDVDSWIPGLSAFIRASYRGGKKLIGICFGHQMLAHALGGHAEKSEKGCGYGLSTFNIDGSKPWMTGNPKQCSLYFAHQDQVMELPPGAELLGGNEFCPNVLYTIDNRVLSIQGHPEFSTELMRDLVDLAKQKLDSTTHQAAVRSLGNGQPDNLMVANWMLNFLNGRSAG
jgi:GMP synthase-like glutamine amidotransferase